MRALVEDIAWPRKDARRRSLRKVRSPYKEVAKERGKISGGCDTGRGHTEWKQSRGRKPITSLLSKEKPKTAPISLTECFRHRMGERPKKDGGERCEAFSIIMFAALSIVGRFGNGGERNSPDWQCHL